MDGRAGALLELDWRGKRESSAREGEDKGVAVHCERSGSTGSVGLIGVDVLGQVL